MKYYKLDSMTKGWFVGDFEPSVLRSSDFEVGVKHYEAGDYEDFHLHKKATEITLILDGVAEMAGRHLKSGDIVEISPNEATDFRAVSKVTTVVVKTPSIIGDKYQEKGSS